MIITDPSFEIFEFESYISKLSISEKIDFSDNSSLYDKEYFSLDIRDFYKNKNKDNKYYNTLKQLELIEDYNDLLNMFSITYDNTTKKQELLESLFSHRWQPSFFSAVLNYVINEQSKKNNLFIVQKLFHCCNFESNLNEIPGILYKLSLLIGQDVIFNNIKVDDISNPEFQASIKLYFN